MKIGVPWPTRSYHQSRVRDAVLLWENPDLLTICSPYSVSVPRFETIVMPRNSSDIGSDLPRIYIKDVLESLLERHPNEDWYGICNSDCVLEGHPVDGENSQFEVLAYHRTDIPNWKYRFIYNKSRIPKDVEDQILAMREKGLSDKQIARKLNRLEIHPPSGHNEWTYITLRELFFEQGLVYFWGQDMFLFRRDIIGKLMSEYIIPHDPILGTGGFDQRLYKWCADNFKTARVINKLFHQTHTSEWSTDDVEYLHNGGDLEIGELQEYADETFLIGLNQQKVNDSVSTFVKNWTPHIVENPLSFISTEKMITATHLLSSFIPPDTDLIVGVARSGLIPASVLACNLHLPLMSVSPEGVVDVGKGARFTLENIIPKKVIVVDDTIFAGRTFKKIMPVLRETFPRATLYKVAIYSTPQAKHLVDYFACELPEPHYLEWNFFNSGPGERAIYDMDGILCRDIAPEHDDDGVRYINALKNAVPKYLPRRSSIRMIVTARLERYREITEEWLARHKIVCDKLVMGPWRTLNERNGPNVVATFKAEIYGQTDAELFVESCPIQAKEIVHQTGKKVLCPAAGRVFS